MSQIADNSDHKEPVKKDQKKQVILLLILVGFFGYLYFFTGIFRPADEKSAEPVPEAKKGSEMVKQKIPGKGDAASSAEQPKAVEKKEPVKQAQAQQPSKPEAKQPAKVETPASAKPVAAAKPPAPKPEQPKAAAVVVKPAPKPAKANLDASKTTPEKQTAKKDAGIGSDKVKEAKKSAAKQKVTILFGDLPEGAVLNDLKARLKKSGISPVSFKPVSAARKMHRLYMTEFSEHDAALSEVSKLRKKGVDAFMGESGDKYNVYAGSYLYPDRAETERNRLKKMGIETKVVDSETSIKLVRVFAGAFADKKTAESKLASIKLEGVTPKVVVLK